MLVNALPSCFMEYILEYLASSYKSTEVYEFESSFSSYYFISSAVSLAADVVV